MFSNILTQTFTLKRSNGTTLQTVTTGVPCSPADPFNVSNTFQDYPLEKLFTLRQVFTSYSGVLAGDYIEIGSKQYAVKIVNEYLAQGKMSAYYQLMVEQQ